MPPATLAAAGGSALLQLLSITGGGGLQQEQQPSPPLSLLLLPVVGAFVAGWGAAWLLLRGLRPNTRRDALSRFKVVSRRWVKPMRGTAAEEEARARKKGQRLGQRYPLSCIDRVVCPTTVINMHYFYEATLDPERLAAALQALVTRHPFLAGTYRGWLQLATVVCDDHGVEFTLAESSWSLDDIHYASPALERISQYEACGFGAGTPWDILTSVFYRAPVARARLTQLKGGGSCLSLSVAHTVMDAKSVMKTVELWAREARRLQQAQQQQAQEDGAGVARSVSGLSGISSLTGSLTSQNMDGDVASSHSSSSSSTSSEGSCGFDEEVLLRPPHLDQIAASPAVAARAASSAQNTSFLRDCVYDAFHAIRQTVALGYMFVIQGLETRTFFFHDAALSRMKGEVMARIKSQQQSQAFVSTNDVLCAAVWKAIQGLKTRPNGPSSVHVNVDVRSLFLSPNTEEESEAFYWGNGVLQCAATDADPAASPLPQLSRAIRRAISDFDQEAVAGFIGALKKKEMEGLLLGPLGIDWRFSHDVIFSSFHPLQADHDFGSGPAFLYHLDLLPALALYSHIHRASELPTHQEWLPQGLYVQMTLPSQCMDELLREHPDFVPVSAPRRPAVGGGKAQQGAPVGGA